MRRIHKLHNIFTVILCGTSTNMNCTRDWSHVTCKRCLKLKGKR